MPTTQSDQFRRHAAYVIPAAAAVAVAVRLPLLDLPAWPDESGFLMVGSGWRVGDSPGDETPYDSYWVDRPPMLVTLYGVADRLGGLTVLRLIGALAAAVTVVCVGWIAQAIDGARAARWAALTATALLSTPFHWSFMVDGELLAAPFVAAGIGCVLAGFSGDGGRRGLSLSCAGGIAAALALLIKQNLADVVVFAVVLALTGLLLGPRGPGKVLRHTCAFVAGALVCGGLMAAWTLAHGTSLRAVYYAMYPFRVDAARSAAVGSSAISWDRLHDLGVASLLSGLLILVVWLAAWGVRRRHRQPPVLALLAVVVFDLFSVVAGTSYWLHYLIQPVVPVAALSGVAIARGSRARILSIGASVMAVVGWSVQLTSPPQTAEELTGEAIARVAMPGDSIVTVLGHSNIDYSAGLSSPYPYLWVVPARTLDPGSKELKRLLEGPSAPTWVVSARRVRHLPPPGSFGATLREQYRPVARICRLTVYLDRDVDRAAPTPRPRGDATSASRCESVTLLPHVLRELS